VIGYYESYYLTEYNSSAGPVHVFWDPAYISENSTDTAFLNYAKSSACPNGLRMLAAVTYGEVGDDRYPQDEWVAVAWSIRNRVKDSRWPNTYDGVITQSGQYDAVNKTKYNTAISYYTGTNASTPNSTEKRVMTDCLKIAVGVRFGMFYTTDESKGANAFHNNGVCDCKATPCINSNAYWPKPPDNNPNIPRAKTPLTHPEGGDWCHSFWIR